MQIKPQLFHQNRMLYDVKRFFNSVKQAFLMFLASVHDRIISVVVMILLHERFFLNPNCSAAKGC